MKRKITSDVRQWWNIHEIHHRDRNPKMIHFYEEKKTTRRRLMMKCCWKSSWWKQFKIDLIFMNRKATFHVGQSWNIVEIHHRERKSEMISFPWQEPQHRTPVNRETLLKFIIFRETLKLPHFDQDKNNIARSSVMKYRWNTSSSKKFKNDDIFIKTKRTPDVGQW